MDFKQLQYFVHVAELGSFTRAANLLDVGQPALSRQIRQIEVELRQNLLVRNGRGVRTTEAGQVLLEHARGILHQMSRMHEELTRVNGSLAGRVCVGLPPTIAQVVTLPLMEAFERQLPNASLSVSEGMTPMIIEGLASGRLDVAMLYNPSSSPDIETEPFIEERLSLVSPRVRGSGGQPISLLEVSRLPLVMPGRQHTIRRLVEGEMASLSRKPRIAYEVDGFPAILSLVSTGAGHTIMPARVVNDWLHPKAVMCRPIVKPELISKLALATSARRTATLTQKALMGILREVAMAVPRLHVVTAQPDGH